MPRPLRAVPVLVAAVFAVAVAGVAPGQAPADKQPPAGKYDPPPSARPDELTLKQIAEKTAHLRTAVEGLKALRVRDDILAEVEVYLKAAEAVVRLDEWYSKDSGKWALTTLTRGAERAKLAEKDEAPWRAETGRWVLRAYRSVVDGSVQPYAVLLPSNYGKDPGPQGRLDIVLHGRDAGLTETKFIATHDSGRAVPNVPGYAQLEVYGRGNNAYRWAGETDVFEAAEHFLKDEARRPGGAVVDLKRLVLRGFSMGGAGAWHLGLRDCGSFAAVGPGAGFTTTHGYIANLPDPLPDYQEKCLRIYDAVRYAENAFNVPVVAYSGEKDPQKAAADGIEAALAGFKEPVRFTHLVAPGLAHQMPAIWQAKAEAEYAKYAGPGKGRPAYPDRVRFVTYSLATAYCDWVGVEGLTRHYEKAVVDATWKGVDGYVVRTENVRRLRLKGPPKKPFHPKITIDGQVVDTTEQDNHAEPVRFLEKRAGKWQLDPDTRAAARDRLEKTPAAHGPIDDAFRAAFVVVPPSGPGWATGTGTHAAAAVARFTAEWDRYFRGALPTLPAGAAETAARDKHLILFGDPESNPLIAKLLPKLPIIWTKEKLIVKGVGYDPRTHLPVLIYPIGPTRYVVVNSGHTFRAADLKGTNALLYPRLGDWAVVRPTPTENDPAAAAVVTAGLFDEFWQFPKK